MVRRARDRPARRRASRAACGSGSPLVRHRGSTGSAARVRRRDVGAGARDRAHGEEGPPALGRSGRERGVGGGGRRGGERALRVATLVRRAARGLPARRSDGRRASPRQPRAVAPWRDLPRAVDGPHRRHSASRARFPVHRARTPIAASSHRRRSSGLASGRGARCRAPSGGTGGRDRRGARVRGSRAAGPGDRRPHRRAGARSAHSRLPRGEGGRPRCRRARRIDLRRRPDDVRARRRPACARAVAVAMEGAFAAQAIESRVRVCEVDRVGARVEVDT